MELQVIGYDYDNFDPEAISVNYPPNGDYTLQIIGEEEKPSKEGHRMIYVHFEIKIGDQSGKQFKISYYVGNPNHEQANWAFEALGRLYFTITGNRPTRQKGIVFSEMRFKNFSATFDASKNAKGDIYPKIKNLKPFANAVFSNANQSNTNAAPTPSWGAPRT